MENKLENKAKFFAQYFGQEVAKCNTGPSNICHIQHYTLGMGNPQRFHLELKNIDHITDEEAEMLGFDDVNHFFISGSVDSMKDELRLLGFAVEWAGWTVEELISFGWIKLK
ncbi:hypothetical protein [Chryseobacterium sp. WLY505]|uniref:hypothetical protein n=1 Tax=Chryseobacterium sp. WLY505 TaxID=3068892 RepID=UPI002796992C|nr:hypothetical protein [Chryseobacterium sp. WLY505]MDQ1855729.1 hypothetical protein [Chryseobacterium sp. WLY505]